MVDNQEHTAMRQAQSISSRWLQALREATQGVLYVGGKLCVAIHEEEYGMGRFILNAVHDVVQEVDGPTLGVSHTRGVVDNQLHATNVALPFCNLCCLRVIGR